MRKIALLLLSLALPFAALAEDFSARETSYQDWLRTRPEMTLKRFLAHISPPDGRPGTVIASPERGTPDYYFHWVRDGALVMRTLLDFAKTAGPDAPVLLELLKDYAETSRIHQMAMFEPKFHVDGRPYLGEWCRPQHDGPALRAITLIGLADRLLEAGDADQSAYVRDRLYDSRWPTASIIKTDLEFVAHHWRETSCDLWEETYAEHFYTRMVQRRALIDGAVLAERLGDGSAAGFYRQQAAALGEEILKHWDPEAGLFRAHLNFIGGEEKTDGIDGAVILGLLHGHTEDGFLPFNDPRVLRTIENYAAHFKDLYPINQVPGIPGLGWGRYTTDTFNSVRGRYGNPWFLITAAAAQIHFRAAGEVLRAGGDRRTSLNLFKLGDNYLKRIRYHAGRDGVLDEQFDRFDGHMSSAPDLTWSYKELADAVLARQEVRDRLNNSLWNPCQESLTSHPRPPK
jgi:glucoamylase